MKTVFESLCCFSSDAILGIKVKLTGSGRVSWKVSRYSYCRAQEVYLDMNNELLSGKFRFKIVECLKQ